MEYMEDAIGPQSGEGVHAVLKGKRTKRQRLQFLPAVSSTSSGDFSGSTTEEEDMANCLILLAQGHTFEAGPKPESPSDDAGGGGGGGGRVERSTSRRFAEAATTTNGKAGFYVYECKTCNKCFPSFQALGGHRASHKKPKTAFTAADDEDGIQLSMNSFAKSSIVTGGNNNNSGNKPRVHECSICGSEFSSGQALGGHMRRHRPTTVPEAKKERNVLSLDLNLPAPSEEHRDEFRRLVFSASALVDCHY